MNKPDGVLTIDIMITDPKTLAALAKLSSSDLFEKARFVLLESTLLRISWLQPCFCRGISILSQDLLSNNVKSENNEESHTKRRERDEIRGKSTTMNSRKQREHK